MDKLKTVYYILKNLETKAHKYEYKGAAISPEALDVDDNHWLDVMRIIIKEELISGAIIQEDISGGIDVDIEKVALTLKGLQYLKENNAMVKFGKFATNVISIVKK